MLKDRIRVIRRHLEHGVHIPKRGSEDDLIPFLGIIADDTSGIGALRHKLAVGRLDAELLLQIQPPLIMGIAPSQIVASAHVDEGDLRLLGRRGRGGRGSLWSGFPLNRGRLGWRLAGDPFDEPVHAP